MATEKLGVVLAMRIWTPGVLAFGILPLETVARILHDGSDALLCLPLFRAY